MSAEKTPPPSANFFPKNPKTQNKTSQPSPRKSATSASTPPGLPTGSKRPTFKNHTPTSPTTQKSSTLVSGEWKDLIPKTKIINNPQSRRKSTKLKDRVSRLYPRSPKSKGAKNLLISLTRKKGVTPQ